MAEKSTYIKLDRNIVRWRWWKCTNTLVVFLWLLLNANVSDHDFENTKIHRGQIATSVKRIEQQTNLTTMQVRTALGHLKSTGEITIKSCNRYQVITIVNYSLYQDVPTNKITNKQQTDNKRITNGQQQYKNNKNDKNEKEYIKGRSAPDSPVGEKRKEPGREEGTYEDIPLKFRDGTWQSFKTWAEYYDWSHQ